MAILRQPFIILGGIVQTVKLVNSNNANIHLNILTNAMRKFLLDIHSAVCLGKHGAE